MSQRLEADPSGRGRRDDDEPRGGKFKALLLVVAVAGIGGGSWWVYRADLPRQAPENVPVIHSDAAPVKTAPTDPGGMVVPDQDSVLLNRQPRSEGSGRNQPKIEELLPDPEPVLPRPVAAAKPAAATPSQPTPSVSEPAASAPTPPAPPVAVAQPPTPQVAVAPPPAVAPTSQAAAAPSAAASGKGYRLQLGALKTEDAAKQEWLRLQKAQADILGKLALAVSRIDLGDKGTYYRIQAGPIADPTQAAQACDTLKSRKIGCILVKP